MQAVNVKTPGIMCSECTAAIKDAVSRISGVVGVTASLEGGKTSVLFDDATTDREAIVAAITQAGFAVTDL